MGESEAKSITIAPSRQDHQAKSTEIRVLEIGPGGWPSMALRAKKRKPNSKPKKKLSDAQLRTKRIRAWMLTQSVRPDLKTYCRAMDAAKIDPPLTCSRAGKSFEQSTEIPRLKQCVTSELSRLWKTRSPK